MSNVSISVLAQLRREVSVVTDETVALAAASRFRRTLHQGNVVAKLEAAHIHARAAAASRQARLTRCCQILGSLLRRYGLQAAGSPEKLADKAAAYVQLERYTNPELTEGAWRKAFEDELRELQRQLEELINLCLTAIPVRPSAIASRQIVSIRVEYAGDQICRINEHLVRVPFSADEHRDLISGYRSPRGIAQAELTAPLKAFGQQLFALIAPALPAGACEIRLHLDRAGDLAAAPWEVLHNGRDFIALQRPAAIVRCIESPPKPLRPMTGPVRVLLTISSPRGLRMLDSAEERRRVADAVGGLMLLGSLELDVAPDGKLETLRRMLRTADESGRPYSAWHFIGHGGYNAAGGRGELAMEGVGGAHYVGAHELQVLFGAHPRFRLAILNACETGLEGVEEPRSGLARTLIGCGMEAVVATQFRISDESAIVLSEEVYGALAAGGDLLDAITEARRAIFCRPNGVEWMTPVLFTRTDHYANTS